MSSAETGPKYSRLGSNGSLEGPDPNGDHNNTQYGTPDTMPPAPLTARLDNSSSSVTTTSPVTSPSSPSSSSVSDRLNGSSLTETLVNSTSQQGQGQTSPQGYHHHNDLQGQGDHRIASPDHEPLLQRDNPSSTSPSSPTTTTSPSHSGTRSTPQKQKFVQGLIDVRSAAVNSPGSADRGYDFVKYKKKGSSLLHRWTTTSRCTAISTALMFLSLCAVLLIHFWLLPYMTSRIQNGLTLANGTASQWEEPDAETILKCYFWNVTNADDIGHKGVSVASVKQIGPYVYRVYVKKSYLSWNTHNQTVSYRNSVKFVFDPNLSIGSESDVITTADIPTVALHSMAGGMSGIADYLLDLNGEEFTTLTVKQLLWGYESTTFHHVVDRLKKIDILHMLDNIVSHIPTSFGYMYGKNNTPSDLINVYTGAGDFSRFNDVFAWNGLSKLPFWSSKTANLIRGSDGSMFHPFLDDQTQLTFFCADLFRAFDLQYTASVNVKGVQCLRFAVPDSQFSNTTMADMAHPVEAVAALQSHDANQDDEASDDFDEEYAWAMATDDDDDNDNDNDEDDEDSKFDSDHSDFHKDDSKDSDNDSKGDDSDSEDDDDDDDDDSRERRDVPTTEGGFCSPKCLPDGMFSLESVSHGTPLFISLPHFLGSDPVYHKRIHGMQPDEVLHRPWFDVDDVTGAVVRQTRRYQLNVRIPGDNDEGILLPLFWVDTLSTVSDHDASQVYLAHMSFKLAQTFRFVFLAVAVVAWCALIGVVLARKAWTGEGVGDAEHGGSDDDDDNDDEMDDDDKKQLQIN